MINAKDKHFLELQFWNKILRKNGKEFQSFFESIMKRAFDDFELVKPCGNQGDRKNDGFRKVLGIYYQVYAPENPTEKRTIRRAAKKIKDDFEELFKYWEDKYPIKEFYFVFNDKDLGVAPQIHDALATLGKTYSQIKFDILSSNKLKDIFFGLGDSDILALGFSLDSRTAIANIQEYFKSVEVDLDRGNPEIAAKALEKIQYSVDASSDLNLKFEFGLLQNRTLQIRGRLKRAVAGYKKLIQDFPPDVRPVLYLAEIYLDRENFEKNGELIEQAKQIDGGHWLITVESLIRSYHLDEQISIDLIDEKLFPEDPAAKSTFYRLHALFAERGKNYKKADEFIKKAILYNPNKFSNYDVMLSLWEREMLDEKDGTKKKLLAERYLEKLGGVTKKIKNWGDVSLKNEITLRLKKINAYYISRGIGDVLKVGKKIFRLSLKCIYNKFIDEVLVTVLRFTGLTDKEFDKLLIYLKKFGQQLSDSLVDCLILQFQNVDKLMDGGFEFFTAIKNDRAINLINSIKSNDADEVIKIAQKNTYFMAGLANTLDAYPDIREAIIREIPEDGVIDKNRIRILFYKDRGQIEKSLEIIRLYNIDNLDYAACRVFAKIAKEARAWDMEVQFLKKLLRFQLSGNEDIDIKIDLFAAFRSLQNYSEAITVGKSILEDGRIAKLMDLGNREILLLQIIDSHLKRSEKKEALQSLEKYKDISHTPNFKMGIEADVYLENNEPEKALTAIVEGAKLLKSPTPEQYGSLFFAFTQISHTLKLSQPLDKIEDGAFVKIKDQDRWWHIGNDEELDAVKIDSENNKYEIFLGKKPGEKITFPEDMYRGSGNRIIENILGLKEYVYLRSINSFQHLSVEGSWDAGIAIKIPEKDGKPDLDNLIKFVKNQGKVAGKDFFGDNYCQKNYPLALLALNEGSMENALGRIQNEQKGFVKLSSGSIEEMDEQKKGAKSILAGAETFLDGSAALFLSEQGTLVKIIGQVPNLKVPQSVVNFLFRISKKFEVTPGQMGHMGLSGNQVVFRDINRGKFEEIRENYLSTIKVLEKDKSNVLPISNASKTGKVTEEKVFPELCDACILAQQAGQDAVVLTDDHLYLQANSLETKKKAPFYTSSFILMKVLAEEGKISFKEYLEYFSYLSSYRCRFLAISVDDLFKSVIGEGQIITFNPENLRYFNLVLTLSEEYGVAQNTAVRVVAGFLSKVIADDRIMVDVVEKIFREIIPAFLAKRDNRNAIGRLTYDLCERIVTIYGGKNFFSIPSELENQKLKILKGQINSAITLIL